MTNKDRNICFEWETYHDDHDITIVALDATLEDFKGQPINVNGKPEVYFKERTVKDCTNIDGCVYFHLGHVTDDVLVRLIEKFDAVRTNLIKAKKFGRKGRFFIKQDSIVLAHRKNKGFTL